MKRIISLLLCMIMLCTALCSCGKKEPEKANFQADSVKIYLGYSSDIAEITDAETVKELYDMFTGTKVVGADASAALDYETTLNVVFSFEGDPKATMCVDKNLVFSDDSYNLYVLAEGEFNYERVAEIYGANIVK